MFQTLIFLLAWRTIPKDETPTSEARGMSLRKWFDLIDASGILLFTVALVALLVGLLSAKSSEHVSLGHIIVGGIGLVALGAFVRHELKTTSPDITLYSFAHIRYISCDDLGQCNVLVYALFFGFRLFCKWYVMSASSIQGFSC